MKKMLLKNLIVTIFLLVTFFSITLKINAANFKYSDFNWKELLEQNKDYWISGCETGDQDCYDRIIKYQETFYKRLYKILAHYQDREGLLIDDKIIIETAFFGITPDSFKDPVDGENNPYNIGTDDDTSFIGSNSTADGAEEYFKNEEDSLKTLINNMVTYKMPCYAVSNEKPKTVDGKTTCSGNFTPSGNECIVLLDNMNVNYMEGLLTDIDIFGFFKTDYKAQCSELALGYPSSKLGKMSKKQEIDEESYWDFLIKSDYFDKKQHLKPYFELVLKKTKHSNMSELKKDEYKEYEKLIKEIRTGIVSNIKSVLDDYKYYASDVSMKSKSEVPSYWWPIGSSETTDVDGKLMATGDPESINITSQYGMRTIDGEEKQHYGIDISGTEGTTNVIASKDGTVISIIDDVGGECINGDTECGDGYGNYVIIQHADGNNSVYAHMYKGSITVKNGDVVKQGQVIGKVGDTGNSRGAHLHFEIRVGGNGTNSAQDPLNYIDPANPRKVGVNEDLRSWLINLEGTRMQGDKYIVFDAEGKGLYRSFGHGIVVEFNEAVIKKHGLNPSDLQYGTLVETGPADDIYVDIVEQTRESIEISMSKQGITLNEKQLNALAACKYNAGNINGFVEAYNSYGATQSLCDNWWVNFASSLYSGLPKRRKAECELFVNGNYINNPYEYYK